VIETEPLSLASRALDAGRRLARLAPLPPLLSEHCAAPTRAVVGARLLGSGRSECRGEERGGDGSPAAALSRCNRDSSPSPMASPYSGHEPSRSRMARIYLNATPRKDVGCRTSGTASSRSLESGTGHEDFAASESVGERTSCIIVCVLLAHGPSAFSKSAGSCVGFCPA
jgi:hypothetical protein